MTEPQITTYGFGTVTNLKALMIGNYLHVSFTCGIAHAVKPRILAVVWAKVIASYEGEVDSHITFRNGDKLTFVLPAAL